MELWIRSQDKEDLLEVHNLGLAYKGKYGFMDKIGDIDGYCICEFINDYHVKLGTYATKERALEVLDEIQSLICPNTIIKINGDMQSNLIKVLLDKFKDYSPIAVKDNDIKVEPIGELLYVMPEE